MSEANVVLLHGLGRTPASMVLPSRMLRARGFLPLNLRYPSLRRPIPELAEVVRRRIDRDLPDPSLPVHFLTHSMGGIVLRALVARRPPDFDLVSAVMLAPPNGGSVLADRIGDYRLFRAITGPAGQELRAGAGCLPRSLGPAPFKVGIIAGDRSISPWSFLVPRPSDGTVSVEETRLEGADDFLVVPRGHTFIMYHPDLILQAIHFFRHGSFRRDDR